MIEHQLVEGPQRLHRLGQQLLPQPEHPGQNIGVDRDIEMVDELFQSGQHIGVQRLQQHTVIVQVFDPRCNRNTNKIKEIRHQPQL